MKQLTLIRHGKSDWHSSADSDFDRPLNGRGKKAAATMGERLAIASHHPDLLVSSPAKRARSTARRIAKQLDYPEAQILYREDIYEADLETLIELIQNLAGEAAAVIMVGHNPGFSELSQWFSSAAPDWLPTCGQVVLELPIDNWAQAAENCATLLNYDYPKKPH